ncbi:DUF3888 domain-containing protein [Alkaliphilus sp. MSJ-5]|uniref:DUF3888 domain-containing protein n=1 Tax=Alkaliphilus flagellatus TaxID=2841507 RepID=A0ABS6G973_9FIRM|nr:DUF3888 domain-containing protein [Alkaliphilus flagellatus]MBU5677926.1 DUF3888 domain-containing protein [Alkaliphilus flagellatus]
MKKIIFVVSLLIISFVSGYFIHKYSFEIKTQLSQDAILQGSKQELYQDIFVTLLLPFIDKAVEEYYGSSYNVAPYDVEVLSIERPNAYRTFAFKIKLKVMPYIGPHLYAGEDHITISLELDEVRIIEFEHIKGYELPPHYKQIHPTQHAE